MERTTKFTIEQLFKKGVRGVDLQPLHYVPFNGKIQQEGGGQCNRRNPTNKIQYIKHIPTRLAFPFQYL